MFPDLRYSASLTSREVFHSIVLGGALEENGMVSFEKALQPEQVESIRAYMVSRALDLKNNPPQNPFGPVPAPAAPSSTPTSGGH
jgi:hypothetical protein